MKLSTVVNCIAFGAAAMGFTSNALADCSDVGSDRWNTLSAELASNYDQGKYEEALNTGKMLTLICDRNPLTNMILSDVSAKLGNEKDSYSYIQRASEYVQDYNLPQPVVKKIWMRLAEFDLPYKQQVAELEKQLEQKDIELEATKTAFSDELVKSSVSGSNQTSEAWDIATDRMYTLQWTGTGIAVGGAALLIAGSVLTGLYYGEADSSYDKKDLKKFADNSQMLEIGIGVIAAGLGLGIAGMITAIVAHKDILEFQTARSNGETTSFSFDIAPTGVGMNIVF